MFLAFLCILFSSVVARPERSNSADKKQVIVVSLPGESDPDYYGFFQHLADIYIAMDGLTEGKDHFFIIHDESGKKYLDGHDFKNAHLIQVGQSSLDMWMRDFPPAVPEVMAKFRYNPGYLKPSEAQKDQTRFDSFAKQVGLPSVSNVNLVLEGGNIVDNGKDIALVAKRVLKENKHLSEDEIKHIIESAINRNVIYIPDPEDTTGHSDGVVSFVQEDVLLVAYYEDDTEYFRMVQEELKNTRIHVLPLPCYKEKKVSHGFSTSEGSYANSLVTYNAVYVPMFSRQEDNREALKVFQENTNKDVVGVPGLDKVAKLGGSIRCMTWQIDQDHPIARTLLEYAEGSGSDDEESDGHDDGEY